MHSRQFKGLMTVDSLSRLLEIWACCLDPVGIEHDELTHGDIIFESHDGNFLMVFGP
uniref:Uncharacterized protein n=1 Tax=Rhizophora mucronata TaxID=61149 RepID=A0A2P2NN57_RHIMU